MATAPERPGSVYGICRATAEELASPLHPPEVQEVSVEALEASSQIGATWTLPDGRVWMRERRSEG